MAEESVIPGGASLKLDPSPVIRLALFRLRATLPQAWPIWLALALWELLSALLMASMKQQVSPLVLGGISVVLIALKAMLLGIAIRLQAGCAAQSWKLDGKLLGYAAILTIFLLWDLAISASELQILGGVAEVLRLAALYLAVRFLLWPIGLLLSEPGATPSWSWRRMDGAIAALIIAHLTLGIIPIAAQFALQSAMFTSTGSFDFSRWAVGLLSLVGDALSLGVNAAVFAFRTNREDAQKWS